MKLLILGGTVFLGRALVEAALAAGHEITIFHRGRRGAELFPHVRRILGDRDPAQGPGLEALRGEAFDAVIDPSGYLPRVVAASLDLLAPTIGHYTFISSISVYRDTATANADENSPLATTDDPTTEVIDGATYGPLKALCEAEVARALPERSLIIRPGLIVGPHDPTDRFTYWPLRVARGGDLIAPEHPGYRVQFIDVRDLAEWTLALIEQRVTGVLNATGPAEPLPIGDLLTTCAEVANSTITPHYLSAVELQAAGVAPWMELPLWVPETPEFAGFSTISIARAIAHGLRFRPLRETVQATLAWAQQRSPDYQLRAGLAADKEAAILAAR